MNWTSGQWTECSFHYRSWAWTCVSIYSSWGQFHKDWELGVFRRGSSIQVRPMPMPNFNATKNFSKVGYRATIVWCRLLTSLLNPPLDGESAWILSFVFFISWCKLSIITSLLMEKLKACCLFEGFFSWDVLGLNFQVIKFL